MKTQRSLVILLALSFAASGCGIFGSGSEASGRGTTAAEESGVPSAFQWQAEVDRRALGKITEPLWLWLDGDQPDGVDVLANEMEPTIRVTVELRHPLYEDEVDHYARLGLEATEGEERPTGTVTREQLLQLAQDHNVMRLDPESVAIEREATARAERTRERRSRARRRL